MRPSVVHPSICEQSAHVAHPFSRTQLRIGQSLSQKGVFMPSVRQPAQVIMSGVIKTPLNFDHKAAVFSRKALSSVIVTVLSASVFHMPVRHELLRWLTAKARGLLN